MTPEQAFAGRESLQCPVEDRHHQRAHGIPDGPLGNFTRVPQYAVAHTVGLRPNPNFPALFTLADGSSEVIVIEFTIPPSPPLVGKIVREVTFPQRQPVVGSNLLDALRKKYGQESSQGNYSTWVFDSAASRCHDRCRGPRHAVCPVNRSVALVGPACRPRTTWTVTLPRN
jgi:hypothetical protein